MSSASDQLSRLLILIPWLRAHPGISTDAVLAEFDLTREQLKADLSLASVCGVPGGAHGDLLDIDFYADDVDDNATDVSLGPVITVLDAQTLQRPMRLDPVEAATVLLGLRLLADLPGSFDRERIDRLTSRLEAIAGDALDAVDDAVAVGEQRTVDDAVLGTLEQAVQRHEVLDLRYFVPSRDEVTDRTVEPIALGVTDGRHYLTAWCRSAEERRTFRVDRILAAAATGEVAPDRTADAHADAADPARHRYTADDDAVRAVLVLESGALWVLEHAVVEQVTDLDGGRVEAVLATHSEQWIAQLVLRAGAGAQVVAPSSLKALVQAQAVAAFAAHQA
jgi:proteasome accessory factor C